MLDKLKLLFEFFSKNGAYLPSAYDAEKQGPSVTLYFSHIAFLIAIIGICFLLAKDLNAGVLAAMVFSGVQTVFYLIRRLSKAKFDLDDRQIELEGEDNEKSNK